ncbi:MAG: bifunctional demethylmenaquinone methyltransferase/2-methoxy-6-polyprenyl-1,4-benzoquinol methylase UbiE [Myxococcota bacterium]|nr:bifunctional demethylmenaquinone methyltransferase/2-methoxy-6-polyprenyl-1,4-benzoquinol methylase UbiE [Myxococcota bacterium]
MTRAETAIEGSGAMFDAIAARYDLLNRLLSFGIDQRWRKLTARSLELTESSRILDLATGTCDLAIRVARHAPGVSVVGVDPSERMLEVGQRKLEQLGLADRIKLEVGDAQRLPFADRSFDGVCIAFGIRNVPDRSRALAEMARVTRPGGRIAILELSEPRGNVLGALARFHVHTVVPWLGSVLSGSREYRYLQRSIAAFPPAETFAEQMRISGVTPLAVRPLTFGVCHLYVGTPTTSE